MTDHTTLITFIILNRTVITNISLYISYVPSEGWLVKEDGPGHAKSAPYQWSLQAQGCDITPGNERDSFDMSRFSCFWNGTEMVDAWFLSGNEALLDSDDHELVWSEGDT